MGDDQVELELANRLVELPLEFLREPVELIAESNAAQLAAKALAVEFFDFGMQEICLFDEERPLGRAVGLAGNVVAIVA